MDRYQLLDQLYSKAVDGTSITIGQKDVAYGDDFLIFQKGEKITITLHRSSVPFYFSFSNDEPLRVEDCPTSFIETFVKNL